MLGRTPFHERTAALCASHLWRRWAGFLVAGSYELTHEREYHAIRSSAALIDISPLYKYEVSGRDAVRLLDRIVTRDVSRMSTGQVLYTTWCEASGKVLDDGTVARLSEERLRMTSADPGLRWLRMNAVGLDVRVEDVSERIAALALQGPASREILAPLIDADLESLRYFRVLETTLRDVPIAISRTGYTGDLGYELWVDAPAALSVWDALIEAGTPRGIVPAGMLALDMARIEAGLMLLDVDYVSARKALIESQKSNPLRARPRVDGGPRKERFVGREALARSRSAGRSGASSASKSTGTRSKRCTRGGARAATADHGVAHERADLRRRRAGGLRDERRLVAAAQEIHRARAPAQRGGRRRARTLEMEVTVEHRRRAPRRAW
jgi:aminomethyltransferase